MLVLRIYCQAEGGAPLGRRDFQAVIAHYTQVFALSLTDAERRDLEELLK